MRTVTAIEGAYMGMRDVTIHRHDLHVGVVVDGEEMAADAEAQ